MRVARWVLLLALAGCRAVGPDYRVPPGAVANAPAAAGPFASAREPAFAALPLPDRWWRLYADPRLDALVTRALAANADLRAADADLRQAIAVVREAEVARTPATTVSGSLSYARPQGVPVATSPTAGYALSGSVSYPIDLFGRIRRSIEGARANAGAVEAARDEVRVTVAAGVARAYVEACSANRSYRATAAVLATQEQTARATERLFRGGRATAFDVTRARTAVAQSAASLPQFVADRQAALFQLGALLGGPPAAYPRELEACPAPPPITSPLPVGDGFALIRRRPDIRMAERSLAAATAQVGVETAGLYPDVSFGGSAGSSGLVSSFASANSFGFSLGPLLTWSFPNRALARARIAAAGAAADAAAAQFDSTVIGALQQAETALSAYARALDGERELAVAGAYAARAAAQAETLFRFGRVNFLDVLTAEATLANAQAALAQSQTSLADAQVQLFQALGGGWQDTGPRVAPAPAAVAAPAARP